MFIHSILKAIVAVAILSSCGEAPKPQAKDRIGLENYSSPDNIEISSKILGDWERCELIQNSKKSLLTKINIGSGIEIKEIVYNDEFCQKIESTKESSIISYFYFEKDKNVFKSKIQEKKKIVYSEKLVNDHNSNSFCGVNDWQKNQSRNLLGMFCNGLTKVTKYDYFEFKYYLGEKTLFFDSKEYKKSIPRESSKIQGPALLINETDSEVLAEKGTRDVMIVLPPRKAEFEIEVRSQFQTNLDLCSRVKDTYEDSLNWLEDIKNLNSKIKKLNIKLDEVKIEINNLVEKLISFIEMNSLKDYDQLFQNITRNEELLKEYEDNFQACESNCQEIRKKIFEQKKLIKDQKKLFSEFNVAKNIKKTYESLNQDITEKDNSILELQNEITFDNNQIKSLTQQYQKNFLQYSKIQGPLSHINFLSLWEENVKALIKKNPHLRFRKASIESTTMEYRIKDLPLLPAAGSIMGVPVSDAKEIVKGRILFPQFPLEIKGRVNLSILAACPASFPEDFNIVLEKPHTLRFEALFNF